MSYLRGATCLTRIDNRDILMLHYINKIKLTINANEEVRAAKIRTNEEATADMV